MSGTQALASPRISPLGWGLIGFRLLLMLLLLIACTPLHFLWRAVGAGRWWPRVFLSSVGAIAGLFIRIEGKPRRGALLLANHVSWLDIPALAHASGTAFVAHDGLSAFPFLKWLCEMNETVFIARHRRVSVADQVAQVRSAMDQSGCLTLFPEGTTSDGTGLLPFKSSLLSALEDVPEGTAVQPVLLAYEDAARIAWVGEEHGLDNFRRILARLRPIRLTIHFLEPLTGADLTDRKSIAASAREKIETKLKECPGHPVRPFRHDVARTPKRDCGAGIMMQNAKVLGYFGLAALLAGCNSVDETPQDKVQRLLERGPRALDCDGSAWSKAQEFAQPRAMVFDDTSLRFDMGKIDWKRTSDAVSGTVRIDHAGYTFEFNVIGFGAGHPYEDQGYFCSKAAIPMDKAALPLGGMTDAGTAMDSEFEPF